MKFQQTATFKISVSNATISQIVVTLKVVDHLFTADDGTTLTKSTENLTQTWSGSSSDVTFTNSSTGNSYIQSIAITYTSTGATKTTPTLSFASTSLSTTVGTTVSGPALTTTNPSSGLNLSYSSSNTGIATVDASTGAVTGVASGSAIITATSAATSDYNSASATYSVTVGKGTLTLSSSSATQNVNISSTVAAPTITAKNANGTAVTDLTYSYAVTDGSSYASVDANGTVTGKAAGTATITATLSSANYNAATITYKVNVGKTGTLAFSSNTATTEYGSSTSTTYPTLSWTDADNTTTTYNNGDDLSSKGISFTSSNTSVATVDANTGVVTTLKAGTATITATRAASDGYIAATASYTLTVKLASNFSFSFKPTSAYLNKGKTIRLLLSYPNVTTEEMGTISVATSDASVATVSEITTVTISTSYVTVTSVDDAVNVGKTVTITATMSGGTKFSKTSTVCPVTITDANTKNFSFVKTSKVGEMFVGDYIAIPGIVGNANYGEAQTFYKKINSTKTGDLVAYRANTDVPAFTTSSSDGGAVSIYYANAQGSTADTLMIYGKTKGTVVLKATDPQNSTYDEYTLTVKDNTVITNAQSTATEAVTYPYTWDFTSNFSIDGIATDDNYWTYNTQGQYYSNNLGLYNINGVNVSSNLNKNVTAGNSLVIPFKGLTLTIGNSTYWASKVDRIRIKDYDSSNPNAPRITFVGGTHKLNLPDATTARETESGTYRIYVKVKGNVAGKDMIIYYNGTNKNTTVSTDAAKWYYFDIPQKATGISVGFNDCDLYDICVSTEAKSISAVNYATYAYSTDLDLALTKESQGVKTYAVTATDDYKATLAEVNKAAAGQGLVVLNASSTAGTATDFYFLPNAKNVDSYTALTGCTNTSNEKMGDDNLLVGVTTATTISGAEGSYWNYILSNSYYKVSDTGTTLTGLGFYIAADNVSMPANTSYLPVAKAIAAKSCYLFSFEDGSTTGIEEINNTAETKGDGYYYNLSGMRISNPTKGIYIHNGKKIIIK